MNLGTVVAKFADVAKFIKVATSKVHLDLITGVPNVSTVDYWRP